MSNHADWIEPSVSVELLDRRSTAVADAILKDIKSGKEINCIAVRGVSGLVMGGVVSIKTRLPLVVVRKTLEGAHSGHKVEFSDELDTLNYAIVDDLISSGATVEEIVYAIRASSDESHLTKVYLYHDSLGKGMTDEDGQPWNDGGCWLIKKGLKYEVESV